MWKRIILFGSALFFFAAANAQLCCRVSINGAVQDGLFSPMAAARGVRLGMLAADEIVSDSAAYPAVDADYALTIRRSVGKASALSDAMLRRTPGVAVTQGVYIEGERLGSVADEAELRSRLRSFIMNQLPTWAVTGTISARLNVESQYGRAGSETDTDDMVLLITGMAPVYYFDGGSHISRA